MSQKQEVILVNISGEDKPGVTSALTDILAKYNVNILDIGQAVIHQDLGLGILFEVPAQSESSPILKDLLFKGYEIGLNIKFTPINEEQYINWVERQGKERYIITLLSPKLTARQLAAVTDEIMDQDLNIDIITRLSGRIPLNNAKQKVKSVVEFSVRGTPSNIEKMKSRLLDIAGTSGVDIAFQEDSIFRRNRRLVCFDMDSTLIQAEVIDELARKAGVFDEVSKITEAAMRGEIDFDDSFRQRVALLKGLDESVMKEVAETLPLTEGAERLFAMLKKYGYRTAILSGGFTYFGNYLKHKLGIDYIFANELEIENGKLTGRHVGEIINGQKKAELIKLITFKEEIHMDQVIAVGDGSNDLPMLRQAGLGIAFHAKPKVRESAKNAISTIGLDAILYLLGFRDREMHE